ncbi:hypothetical protein E2R65_00580 [Mucilaginibacter phyllosphaerae]|uniref:Uncharacterized protein n=1 Tax=Mucilaginibacter phyllosphaerae TaxID=1812349 RepID=A0A4Y8AJK2_9SPHI|nr:hypothetical protein [Mucilaginibacter phyllosphaerae]MBB3968305.1 hypothetical protein [Mucilaginibacter phyllosphaerae]TEW68695.1 hypothetical protein E2R65_00580 [Mucilaginibacter phyllosphaerae]GGG99836.1 hypothetical protein GCM10007352_00880 [Mucilaginibacter phyllosphaerae]
MITVLVIVNPAQAPHEKKGEHPAQSCFFALPACPVLTTASQSLSVQHGLTDRKITINENRMQSSFTGQKYQLNKYVAANYISYRHIKKQ